MADRACTNCKKIVEEGTHCPICKNNDLTTAWKGMLVVYDAERSDLADEVGVNTPGKYAIRVKG